MIQVWDEQSQIRPSWQAECGGEVKAPSTNIQAPEKLGVVRT
jgi:hypothetical protein